MPNEFVQIAKCICPSWIGVWKLKLFHHVVWDSWLWLLTRSRGSRSKNQFVQIAKWIYSISKMYLSKLNWSVKVQNGFITLCEILDCDYRPGQDSSCEHCSSSTQSNLPPWEAKQWFHHHSRSNRIEHFNLKYYIHILYEYTTIKVDILQSNLASNNDFISTRAAEINYE